MTWLRGCVTFPCFPARFNLLVVFNYSPFRRASLQLGSFWLCGLVITNTVALAETQGSTPMTRQSQSLDTIVRHFHQSSFVAAFLPKINFDVILSSLSFSFFKCLSPKRFPHKKSACIPCLPILDTY